MSRDGQIVADRFSIERLAGQGGMGSVYRALDRQTGAPVALKVLHRSAEAHRLRFLREAQLLGSLSHPGIVRLVEQGETAAGEAYLAMEWLEGRDLGERLRARGMSPAETLALVRAVAAVLDVAHAHGVVHRDVKPANLFLVDDEPSQVKVLDFGIARLSGQRGGPSTQTGAMLGTPGYMSPEQARGMREVDGRADLFSLGCVMFECLAGWPPFWASHDVAVLAKILLDEPPRLRAQRPDLPPELDQLVADLLAKDPARRVPSARALLERLGGLASIAAQAAVKSGAPPARALTGGERQLFSVVLAGEPAALTGGDATVVSSDASGAQTTMSVPPSERDPGLRGAVERLGGALEVVAGETYVVSLSGESVASDQAERAARCALLLRGALPERAITVATGHGESQGRFPVGEVIDRAARLLREGTERGAIILLDRTTANLLGGGFDWQPAPGGGILHGLAARAGGRSLLGRATPFVGRERELARLADAVAESGQDGLARALLVTAPPGVGKSRLRDELVRQLAEQLPELEIWTGRGDPVRAGSPYHVLGQVVRRAARVASGATPEARREALRARVERFVPAPDRPRVAAFLGELAQLPFDDHVDLQLRSARRDPQLMADQTRRAFEDFLRAELAAHPVLVLLDDLQWGDAPTVRLLDAALRSFAEAPLCVIALSRPEVHGLFPNLWTDRGLEELRLRELPRRAAEQLVRSMLGAEAASEQVARLVAQSEGNAFFLEELIRAAAEGTRQVPETLLAMLQARLASLDPLCRRVLRAGSIFGQLFWEGGVVALCGEDERRDVAGALEELVRREVVERVGVSRFAAEQAFQFRHALVQDAAGAMLTDADRALGHRLALAWLTERGETDALVLAEHAASGGELERAVELFHQAAEEALRANDLRAAIERAERAVALGARGELLGRLRLLQSEAGEWLGEPDAAAVRAQEAVSVLARGSTPWYRAVIEAGVALSRRGEREALGRLCRDVLAIREPGDVIEYVGCAARLAWPAFVTGQAPLANALLDAVERSSSALVRGEPLGRAALHYAGATRAQIAGSLEDWTAHELGSVEAYTELGDERRASESRAFAGYVLCCIGAYEESRSMLETARAQAEKLGLPIQSASAAQNLGMVHYRLGELDSARERVLESLSVFSRAEMKRNVSGSHSYLARIELARGDLAAALRAAEASVLASVGVPLMVPLALTVRAEVSLAMGQLAAARADAEHSAALLEELGGVEEGEELIWLMVIETALACGDRAAADAALVTAVHNLDARAGRIVSPARREQFESIAEHRRTRELARARGVK